MDLDSVLEDVLRSSGQGNLILKSRKKEALQSIVFKGQDCLIVLPTGYGKSLIYQMLPSLFHKMRGTFHRRTSQLSLLFLL